MQEVRKGGFLILKKLWPSLICTIWSDLKCFLKSYGPEDLRRRYCLAGDGAIHDASTG